MFNCIFIFVKFKYSRRYYVSKQYFLYVYSDFTIKAITDIERFQNQRVTDLKETLTSYAFLELKTAKKVR